jgi:hypothetical protein
MTSLFRIEALEDTSAVERVSEGHVQKVTTSQERERSGSPPR